MANRKPKSPPASPTPAPAPAPAPAPGRRASTRPRVRRGSEDDAQKLHDELLAAALALFIEGGLPAVTMRAVATNVGVSAMTPYRYFEDKGDLLRGIWAYAIEGACRAMQDAAGPIVDVRQRVCAELGAFIDYWERNPEHYRLVYMTEQTMRRDQAGTLNALPAYVTLMDSTMASSRQLAEATGGDPANVKLATDMRVMMLGGYLHGRLVNRRYPWSSVDVLRPAFLDAVLAAMDTCLRRGQPDAAPAKGARRPQKS